MKFYQNEFPTVHEITMCTVTACDPSTGFNVHLDEYDLDGFLMGKELSAKKIKKSVSSFLKVGTQLPLSVVSAIEGDINLSKKDVKPQAEAECRERFMMNEKLFSLARRLSHLTDKDEMTWIQIFLDVQDPETPNEEHPYALLSNRTADKSELEIDALHLQVIEKYHAKLFGINPIVMRVNFVIQALGINSMEVVKQSLIKIRDQWTPGTPYTNEALYNDPTAVNVAILPLAIPTFQLQITAYNQPRCDAVFKEIKKTLEEESFDYLEFTVTK